MTLPVAMLGMDVIGQARTGTGKTLAFGIPVLQRILAPTEPAFDDLVAPGKPQALVVVPTRELALQVAGDLKLAEGRSGIRLVTVYGGRAYEPQLEALARGIEIVVGTPGRLLDLADQGHLDLGHVKILVLDEADEMLDLGFLPDVEKIIGLTPGNRQTLLFSATMPAEVVSLARRYLRQPTNIRAEGTDETAIVPQTVQHVFRAHALDKVELVARVLQAEGRGLTMIFCPTKRAAQQLADDLGERGFATAAVHGDLGQGAREQALRAFRSGKVDVLVATDVAARGIDVEGVTHVINYQCPDDEKTYLHRIGRTGRAGASGVAVTLVDWDDLHRWSLINRALGLSFDEPMESYSTSEHLYDMLGIPADATGVLPPGRRTRAGLGAERIEDLGEPVGRRPRRGTRGGPRSGGEEGPRRRRSRGRAGSGTGDASGERSDQTAVGGDATGRRRSRPDHERADDASDGTSAATLRKDPLDETRDQRDRGVRRRRRLRGGKPVAGDTPPAT
jgi:superfamily II DNA/RNA helicase